MSGAEGRANRRRGEVEAVIDGERRILCLTLGALAELETAFGVANIAALAARFSEGGLGAEGMIKIIAAGLRGGGNLIDEDDVRDCRIEGGVEGAVRLTAALLTAAFLPEEAGDTPPFSPGRPAGRPGLPPFPGAC